MQSLLHTLFIVFYRNQETLLKHDVLNLRYFEMFLLSSTVILLQLKMALC